jgi:hypothetical protein
MSVAAPRVHAFSWSTRVSLELPPGFEPVVADATTNSATYMNLVAAGQVGVRIVTRAMATSPGVDGAYRDMALDSAAQPGRRTIDARYETQVDGYPAVRLLLRCRDEATGFVTFRHETYAQVGNIVFTIVATVPAGAPDGYLEVFEHASRTARFVLL